MATVMATAFLGLIIVGTLFKVFTWRKAYTIAKTTNPPVFSSPYADFSHQGQHHSIDAWQGPFD